MNPEPVPIQLTMHTADADPWFNRLSTLYAEMDRAYEETAGYYGFVCNGCSDNCCNSLFFHHTIVECLYLIHGFRRLPPEQQSDILRKAASLSGPDLRGACPLLWEGRCRLYPFRPMICRLHGIPHQIRFPGRPPTRHPGCAAFECHHPAPFDRWLDRTPLYTALAQLEQETRAHLGFRSRIHLTVAQILNTFTDTTAPQ